MATPLDIAREQNRNYLLYNNEDLVNELYNQYQDRYPDKRLFTEFLTTDTNTFDKSRLTGTTVQPSPETIEEEPKEEKPFGLSTLPEFGADLITSAIPAGTIQAVGSGLKYGAGLQKMPDYLSGDLQEVTAQYRAALSILNEKDQYSAEIVNRAEQIVDTYRNQYSAKESEFFKAGEQLQQFAQETFPQDQRWKDNKLADTIYKGFEGIGSTVPIIAASVVGAPFGVGTLAGLGTAIAMEGGESIDRVYSFDGDTDENDVVMATILGVAPGSADYLPVQILLNRFNKVVPGVKSRVANILKQSVTQGVWEGGTEEFQNVLQNLIEQTYNKERETFDYAGEQFGPGFVAGLVFGGIGGGVRRTREKKLDDTKDDLEIGESDEISDTKEIIPDSKDAYKEMQRKNLEEGKPQYQSRDDVGESFGEPDEIIESSHPKGTPPPGTNNVTLTLAGERIGTGRVVEYPLVGKTDQNIKIILEDGSSIEQPLSDKDLEIDWADKPKVKEESFVEEVTPTEEVAPVEEIDTFEQLAEERDLEQSTVEKVINIARKLFDRIPSLASVTNNEVIDQAKAIKQNLGEEYEKIFLEESERIANERLKKYIEDKKKEEVVPAEEKIKPSAIMSEEDYNKLEKQWNDLPVGEGLRFNEVFYQKTQIREPLPEEIKPSAISLPTVEEVAPVEEEVKKPKEKLLTDNIKTVGNWNNVFNANKNNEDTVNQLTNFNLEDLIAKENNVTVLNQAKSKLYQAKALGDNTVAKSNIQLVQNRITELKKVPVKQPTPVVGETPVVKETTPEAVAPTIEEKPLTSVEKIFAEPDKKEIKVEEKETEDVLTEEQMAGVLTSLLEESIDETQTTDAVTKETPVVEEKPKVEEVPSDPKERAKFYNDNVAEVQRGEPEEAMLRATMHHGGILSSILENAGDLIHRATERGGKHGSVKEKVDKLLRFIRLTPGDPADLFPNTAKAHEKQIKSNAKSRKVDEKEYRNTLNNLLADYVAEHEKMPTYNELQENAKQVAISVGKLDFEKAIKHIKFIKNITDKGREFFNEKALEYYGDKETPVVEDKVTQREQAVQKKEDDITYGQGIFKLYDPRSPITSAKQYNNALNAYRREIADPSITGKKYLQDVESAYAQRVNELTDNNKLDRVYLVDQTDPLNYTQFTKLLNELGNATFDIKDQATGKLIRKKTKEIKVKPVKDAIKYIKDKNYDKKPPETPPLPEFAEQKEEVSERDSKTITDVRDIERGESVLGSRGQVDTDISRTSRRDISGQPAVRESISRQDTAISREGEPRGTARDDKPVDPSKGQDLQSRNAVEGTIIGKNITSNVSGQLGSTVTGSESGIVSSTTETQQELRDDFQRNHNNRVDNRSLSNNIGKIKGLNEKDKQIIKDVFTYDSDIFEEVYLDYDPSTIQGFKKTTIPSYLQNDIEETLIDTMDDQQELLQQIYDVTKNKYPDLSTNINRYHQEKLEEGFDDFANSLNDLKSKKIPPSEAGASGIEQVEYGSQVMNVPTIKPTKESYDKIKPQLLKRLDQHSKAGLPWESALKAMISDIDRAFVDQSLTSEQQNEARKNSEQWKTSMGAFLRFSTDVYSSYKNVQGERNTIHQIKYNPKVKTKSLDTHMPIELLGASNKGLRNLDIRVGNISQYVADNLDMNINELQEKFGAEQIEALGLAIDQLKAGKGFVLGDQTGIGKGRVVAALMRYGKKNASHVVFITAKPNLYTDMLRDLKDIGENISKTKILATNNNVIVDLSSINEETLKTDKKDKHEALLNSLIKDGVSSKKLEEYDYIFTTYDQLNRTVKTDQLGFGEVQNAIRHNFIQTIAPNTIFILDESHNAGGTSNQKLKENSEDTRAEFIRTLLRQSRGSIFSSATWAKNPMVMDLYMNTDINEAIPDSNQFVDVMKKRGIPLQQIITNMLAQTGQYRRVERSFDGVEYGVYNDGKGVIHDINISKKMSELILDIHLLDLGLADVAKKVASLDPEFVQAKKQLKKTGHVQTSDFKGQMFNLMQTVITSFKLNETIDYTINEVKNENRKVIITVSKTNESLVKQIMTKRNLKVGDNLSVTFNDILLRYLERTLSYSMSVKLKGAKGRAFYKEKILSNNEIAQYSTYDLVKEYQELKNKIEKIDFGNLSPISLDLIINKLTDNNIKIGEITGREYSIDSKGIINSRSETSLKKRQRIDNFQDGKLDVLIINQSGATGFSMHSDQRAKDQKQRHMIILEPEPEINTYIQMLGRVFRTGQVSLPKYTIMTTDHPAEGRFSAMLSKKMASLNATVTGGKDSVYTTSDSLDFFNSIGDKVTKEFLESHAEIRDVLDIDLTKKIDGIANKVSSNLLMFDPDLVNEYYEFVKKRYPELKQEETAFGTNILDMDNLTNADAKNIEDPDMIQDGNPKGSPFEQPVYMEKVSINKKTKPFTQQQLQKELRATIDLTTENIQLDKKNVQEKVNEYNEKQLNQAVEIYDTAIEKIRQNTTKKPEQIQSQVKKLQDVKNQITRNIRSFPVGTQVRISLNTGKDNAIVEHGIILDRIHEGISTATNTGSFKIKIALAQGDAQKITLGLSRFIDNQGNLSSENTIENALTTPEGKLIDELFVSGQENVRENRYIVTGNLATGSAIVGGGQFAKLQRDTGEIIQTIIMPKNYKHDKQSNKIPVLLDYRSALHYIYKSKFGELKTFNSDVRIQKTSADSVTIFTTRRDVISNTLEGDEYATSMPKFNKSSDGKTWFTKVPLKAGGTATGFDPINYIMYGFEEAGINFQSIKEQDVARESKEQVISQNLDDFTPRSIGAMATPPDMNDGSNKDDVIRRAKSTLTSLFKITKNKKRFEPFISKDRESTDRIHLPKEILSKIEKEGWSPLALIPLRYILPSYVTANQLKDKAIPKLIQKGIEFQSKIRVRSKTFIDRYKRIRTKFKDANFSKVVDLLFVGDASQKIFTDEELKEGFTLTKKEIAELRSQGFSRSEINKIKSVKFSNSEIQQYKKIRLLFDAMGKYIDQHRRYMLKQVRPMQALIRARLYSLVAPDSLKDLKKLMIQRSNKMKQVRNGLGNPQTVLAELLEIDLRIYSIPLITTSETDSKKFLTAVEQYYQEENKLQDTSVRRKMGYIPHKFFGSFKLKIFKGIDENGNEIYENLINPKLNQEAIEGLKAQGRTDAEIESIASAVESSKNTLFFKSKEDAIRAAQEHIKNNPEAEIRIEPTDMKVYSGDATILNDIEYRSIMNNLTESLSEKYTPEELQGSIKDVMRRKGRRRIPEFSLKRQGIAGYDKNLDKVFRTFAGSVANYVYMDELKYDYINLTERKGWGEVSEVSDEARPIAEWMRSWYEDLNNKPSGGEVYIDKILNKFEKVVPKKVFYAAGVGAVGAGVLTSLPFIPFVLGGSTAIMMGRAHSKSQRKSRAITGDMLSLSAHFKLGAFFNLSSALVNLSQIALNTYSKMGAALTSAGFRRAVPALYRLARNDYIEIIENRKNYSVGKVQAAMDALLLASKAEIKSSYFYSDRAPDIFTEQSKLGQLSMLWFQSAETLNRATSFFAGYIGAEKKGKNREQAIKSGLFAIQQQQFSYDNAAKPGILRNTFLRVPLQFKNWFIQELVFISGLRGAEIPRFLASTFVLAGALGSPAFMLISELVTMLTGYEPEEDLKEWALAESAKGNLNGMVGQFITHGAPAIISQGGVGIGINLTNRVGFGDRFLPTSLNDLSGPFINTIMSADKLTNEGATAVDQLVNLSPAFKPLKSIEAIAGGMPFSTILTEPQLFTNKMLETLKKEQKPVYTNPYKNQAIKYEVTLSDVFRMTFGFEPTKVAQFRELSQSIRHSKEIRLKTLEGFRTDINVAVRKYGSNYEQLNIVLTKIIEQAIIDGVEINRTGVRRMIKDAFFSQIDKDLKTSNKVDREEIIEQIKALEKYYGLDFSQLVN